MTTTTLRAGQRHCPCGCGRIIATARLACRHGLDQLPADLRAAVDHAPSGTSHRDREQRADAAQDARDWWLAHPSPRHPDAGIAGVCEHCTAELLWLTTGTQKRMPVDARPDPERGSIVRIGATAGVLGVQAAAAARAAGTELWLHHAASCPHADRWQGPRTTTRRKARR